MLSNPITRLCILINLTLNGKKNVTELMNCSLKLGKSSVSQQLTKLKLAKIISASTKSGNEVYHELSSKGRKYYYKKK